MDTYTPVVVVVVAVITVTVLVTVVIVRHIASNNFFARQGHFGGIEQI